MLCVLRVLCALHYYVVVVMIMMIIMIMLDSCQAYLYASANDLIVATVSHAPLSVHGDITQQSTTRKFVALRACVPDVRLRSLVFRTT